jgi:hypothetical protein
LLTVLGEEIVEELSDVSSAHVKVSWLYGHIQQLFWEYGTIFVKFPYQILFTVSQRNIVNIKMFLSSLQCYI